MGMQGSAIDSRTGMPLTVGTPIPVGTPLPVGTPQNFTPADISTVYDANVGPRKGTVSTVSGILITICCFCFYIRSNDYSFYSYL